MDLSQHFFIYKCMENVLIKAENLSFKYLSESILHNINLSINRKEFMAIIGPRGEGKSTLLKLLAGLFLIEEGHIYYDGLDLRKIPKEDLMEIHRKTAYVFQDAALISNMKIFDNLALPLRYHEIYPEEEIQRIVNELLESVDLMNVKNLLPAYISMGQRRIIALLRALIMQPETIFYDEPLANLDRPSRNLIKRIISETLKRNVTSILITHEFKDFESLITKVVVLKKGTIYKIDSLDMIMKSNDPYIQGLIA